MQRISTYDSTISYCTQNTPWNCDPNHVCFAVGLVNAQVPECDHVVVVIFENHSYAQIIGNPAAPNLDTLAANGAN